MTIWNSMSNNETADEISRSLANLFGSVSPHHPLHSWGYAPPETRHPSGSSQPAPIEPVAGQTEIFTNNQNSLQRRRYSLEEVLSIRESQGETGAMGSPCGSQKDDTSFSPTSFPTVLPGLEVAKPSIGKAHPTPMETSGSGSEGHRAYASRSGMRTTDMPLDPSGKSPDTDAVPVAETPNNVDAHVDSGAMSTSDSAIAGLASIPLDEGSVGESVPYYTSEALQPTRQDKPRIRYSLEYVSSLKHSHQPCPPGLVGEPFQRVLGVHSDPSGPDIIGEQVGSSASLTRDSRVEGLAVRPLGKAAVEKNVHCETSKVLHSPRQDKCRIRYSLEFILSLRHSHGPCPAALFRALGEQMLLGVKYDVSGVKALSEAADDTDAILDACGVPRSRDVIPSGADEHTSFEDLSLSPAVLAGLQSAGFYRPSPVQIRGIPLGRLGIDMIAQAKSGTGKTLVFSVISLETVLSMPREGSGVAVMILAPTRDIAAQIKDVLVHIGRSIEPKVPIGLYIGGASIKSDEEGIRKYAPPIAVGTPGRVLDLLHRGVMDVSALRLLIIDEADRLLDGSFGTSVSSICSMLPRTKQVTTFSATYSLSLLQSLKSVMRAPQYVNLCDWEESDRGGETSGVNFPKISRKSLYDADSGNARLPSTGDPCPDHRSNNRWAVLRSVRQLAVALGCSAQRANQDDGLQTALQKLNALVSILSRQPFGQAVVFLNDKTCGRLVKGELCESGFAAVYTSGSEPQATRTASLEAMRKGNARVLVATDLIARGVDLPGCDLVVHLDVPSNSATYLHRVGRTGRFGSRGVSILLFYDGPEKNSVDFLQRGLQLEFQDAAHLVVTTPAYEGASTDAADVPGDHPPDDCPLGDETDSTTLAVMAGYDAKEAEATMHVTDDVAPGQSRVQANLVDKASVSCNDGSATAEVPGLANQDSVVPGVDSNLAGEADPNRVDRHALPDIRAPDVSTTRSEPVTSPPGSNPVTDHCVGTHQGIGASDAWDQYAQEAFRTGHQAGYEMAQRMARDILSRLGPGGLSAMLNNQQ